jgi:hypothetical protein
MSVRSRVEALKREHPDWGRGKISKELGISRDSAKHHLQSLQLGVTSTPEPQKLQPGLKESFEVSGNNATATLITKEEIKTAEDLMKYMKIDPEIWECYRMTANKWEMGYVKREDGETTSIPLVQIKACFKRRVAYNEVKGQLEGLLSAFKDNLLKTAPERKATPVKKRQINLLELSVVDLHYGKLCWPAETRGDPWDSKIAAATQERAIESLLERSSGFDVSAYLVPIGNDFFHVDNANNSTHSGTPQDCDGRWQKSFTEGRILMVNMLEKLLTKAPVHVVMVQGNHDMERLYYLGDALESWFHNASNLTIDNRPALRKYYQYGKNLLGFTHGNNEKLERLPVLMANECKQEWADTTYREWHLGHIHCKKGWIYQLDDEYNTVRTRIIPSLVPPDAWHASMGYDNLRSAEAYLWSHEGGCVGQFSFQP